MNALELIGSAAAHLCSQGIAEGRGDAEVLLAFCLNTSRAHLVTSDVSPEQAERFWRLIHRRATNYPVQYLVGEMEWMDFRLDLDPRVFIPRPETERLAELCIERIGRRAWRVLDVGTGSGPLAISIARHCPRARVAAIDINPAACELARRNAQRNNTSVVVFRGSLLQSVRGPIDLVVANLPYVPLEDVNRVGGEVLHEPSNAVFAADGGLALLREFERQARGIVRHLFLEAAPEQMIRLEELFGYAKRLAFHRDWGPQQRFLEAEFDVR